MFKKLFLVMIILLMITSKSFAGSVLDIREGKWEITTRVEMQGIQADLPPMTSTKCLTGKDSVPKSPDTAQNCTFTNVKTDGNIVTWIMKCNEQVGGMEGRGKITYHGDTFNGTITMSLKEPGESKITMIQRLSGKRIGECK